MILKNRQSVTARTNKSCSRKARRLNVKARKSCATSEGHEHRHHILTVAVTLLHVAIAIATIAIIMRGQRWPWYAALALGVLGSIGAAYAYLG